MVLLSLSNTARLCQTYASFLSFGPIMIIHLNKVLVGLQYGERYLIGSA